MNKENTIFISHSSEDKILIDSITLAFKNQSIEPYFAKREMAGKNPVEKILEAIEHSIGLFVLVTPKVVNSKHTRDWVVFELGIAKARGKSIFGWIDSKVEVDKNYPDLVRELTDFLLFDCQNLDSCFNVAKCINEKAFQQLNVINAREVALERNVPQINFNQESEKLPKKDACSTPNRKNSLLPDRKDIGKLNIKNSFLDKIYKKANHLAIQKHKDATLSNFAIHVLPFQDTIFNVSISFEFFSKTSNKLLRYQFDDTNYAIKFSPPEYDANQDFQKKTFSKLPWKESPKWLDFLKIAISKTGPIPDNPTSDYTFYVYPFSFSLFSLTKGISWTFSLSDRFMGKTYTCDWNGKKIDENIKIKLL
jgi:hypothetical protein